MVKIGEVSGRGQTRRLSRLLARTCAAAVVALTFAGQADVAAAEDRSLTLYNAHTRERATIVYKRDGRYDRAGLKKLNYFLRDWRKK